MLSKAAASYDLHDSFCHPSRITLQLLSVLRPPPVPNQPPPPSSPVPSGTEAGATSAADGIEAAPTDQVSRAPAMEGRLGQ